MAATPQSSFTAGQSLYLFSLPLELVASLQVRLNSLLPSQNEPEEWPNARSEALGTSLGCAACGISAFSSVTEQRLHFRSDWHRYNVKVRLGSTGQAPVTEEAFSRLLDSLDDSLSGSASSDSSVTSSDSANAVSRLIKRTHLEHESPEEKAANRSPLLWMTADALAPDTQFGMYRVVIPSSDVRGRTDPSEGWSVALRKLQVQPEIPRLSKKAVARAEPDLAAMTSVPVTPPESRTWTFLFTGGGHFAGMIVSLVPKLSRGQGGKLESSLQVLAHKTYHRYTTRRKQGGAQSANDAAKGTAKSVGSQLRRANEMALAEDIRALLLEWKPLLLSSELVFTRASRSNSRIFFDYPDALLKRGDTRIRSVPFSTRRPTLAELERCFKELTTVKCSHLTADALAALDEAELKKQTQPLATLPSAVSPPPASASKAQAPKLSKEELLERDRWARVLDMTRRGRLDALISFIDRHPECDYTAAVPDWLGDRQRLPTLLHIAAQADQSEVVRWLLYDCKADPTAVRGDEAANGLSSRPAYDLASSKATRNVFRRCMADHPDRCDWTGGAHVPSPLSAEQEAKEQAREEVKRKAREREEVNAASIEAERLDNQLAAQQAQEAERARHLAAQQAAKGGPQRLGGGPPQRLVNSLNGGLTEEQKTRMEREQRARAAEARLRRA